MKNAKTFSRSINELENIFSFLEKFEEKFHLDTRVIHDIELSVEKIFTNTVRRNSDHFIEISLEKK